MVGLYLNPPQQAMVLCVDEKSQIQALDRTQPGLPIKKGRCGTMTHDYKRNGTTTLFAALETLQGKVVGECHQRHRHQEFLKFLRRLDKEFPGKIPLHLVMDNYGTHKHEKVRAWLKRHPRFVPHFVPTSSSWLNLVERWFGHLQAGEGILLSDGLSGYVDDARMGASLAGARSTPEEAVRILAKLAADGGNEDNISVQFIRIRADRARVLPPAWMLGVTLVITAAVLVTAFF